MAQQEYSQELHDLMLHCVQLNAGLINQKKLMEEVEKLKLYNGKHKIINQPWIKALDYLDDYKTKIRILQDLCNFQHTVKIIIESKSSKYPDKMLTSILEVKSTDTVESVKIKIQHEIYHQNPPSEQHLYLKQKLLDDDKTMTDYKIQNGTVLRLEVATFHIICVFTDGRKLHVEVTPSNTVENLKHKISKLPLCMPPDQQRLIHDGKQLEDGRTLADYNITSGTVIYLVERLRGS